jgi:hypothetical protein
MQIFIASLIAVIFIIAFVIMNISDIFVYDNEPHKPRRTILRSAIDRLSSEVDENFKLASLRRKRNAGRW